MNKDKNMKKYKTIKDLLKDIVKHNKVEVYGGINKEEWFEIVGIPRLDDCSGGIGLIVKRARGKTRMKFSVQWFKRVRITPPQ